MHMAEISGAISSIIKIKGQYMRYIIFQKMKKILILILLLTLVFCCCKKKIDITPQIDEYQSKIAEADSLLKKGSYSFLKKAFNIYHDLLYFSDYQIQTKEKLIKTALLLAIRQKELAILDQTYLNKASELIKDFPVSSEFPFYYEVVDFLSVRGMDVASDSLADRYFNSYYQKRLEAVKDWNNQLKAKAETEEFLAYLYLSLNYSYYFRIEEEIDFRHFLQLYPDSPLMTYIVAICQRDNNEELLNETIEKEPSFTEVYYFMGENSLEKRKLIAAEKHFLKTYQEIPQSSSTAFSLAKVYYFIGEIENSLEFYEKTIQLAPEYRKALLGKAICLSNLGRYEEAIAALDKILALGKWYLGETHYWLAWNQNALERLQEAGANIEKSKLYLTDDSKMFTLAGIISFRKEQLGVAEINFKKALDLDRSACQALFYLGRIYSQRQDWVGSGFYFEQVANCYEAGERAIRQKITEIEGSALSQVRKKRLILRKEKQLEETIFSKATSFYNGAACYFNANFKDEALRCAEKAALHPSHKDKAEELISKIKELK